MSLSAQGQPQRSSTDALFSPQLSLCLTKEISTIPTSQRDASPYSGATTLSLSVLYLHPNSLALILCTMWLAIFVV